MKKYMIADLVKEAENEADAAIRAEVAESLGLEPGDVDDDDVENYLSMGGCKGDEESSIGPIQWIYDNTTKAYVIYMVLETFKGPRDVMYKIDPDMLREWKNSDSMGEYYNKFIRGNEAIEDPKFSCGCGPNPCEPGQVDTFKARYSSLS